jgi:HK97 gp10 family phage protein
MAKGGPARIVVRGLTRLQGKVRNLTPETKTALRVVIKATALNVQSGARRRTPVDTGRLRNSVTHELTPDGLSARIGTNVEYAPFVEFGTRRARAQPYLFPAAEAESARFQKAVRKAVLDALRRAAG